MRRFHFGFRSNSIEVYRCAGYIYKRALLDM